MLRCGVTTSKTGNGDESEEHADEGGEEKRTTASFLDETGTNHRKNPVPDGESTVDAGLLSGLGDADLVENWEERGKAG